MASNCLPIPAKPNQERAPITNATATLRAIDTVITADAGYHSQDNLKALAERQSMPTYATTAIASVMNATPINTCMPPNPIYCGTKRSRPKNPIVLNLRISAWQMIAPIAFVLRASGSTAMDRVAPSMVMRR
jgi:hypothetical protein